ncbi:hypothetical protein [uncultured Clostridium sp.]|uniref:hypothetical protein n=1 Tax=uncultured Clostridium sp. TaxID=59620 RepID=UPI003216742F
MLSTIISIVSKTILAVWTFQLFYKKRKVYNLLFCIFFISDLLRLILLDKYIYLPTNVTTLITSVQLGILIAAIILFFKNKYKVNSN